MAFLISLITSRLAGPAASIVAVILLALCVGQCTRAVKAEGRQAKAEAAQALAVANYERCKVSRLTLQSAITAQNAAVVALKAKGDAMVAASRKAASAARSVAESHRRNAAAILGAKPKGVDACVAADKLIAEFTQ